MPQISIIKKSDIQEARRFDAEQFLSHGKSELVIFNIKKECSEKIVTTY